LLAQSGRGFRGRCARRCGSPADPRLDRQGVERRGALPRLALSRDRGWQLPRRPRQQLPSQQKGKRNAAGDRRTGFGRARAVIYFAMRPPWRTEVPILSTSTTRPAPGATTAAGCKSAMILRPACGIAKAYQRKRALPRTIGEESCSIFKAFVKRGRRISWPITQASVLRKLFHRMRCEAQQVAETSASRLRPWRAMPHLICTQRVLDVTRVLVVVQYSVIFVSESWRPNQVLTREEGHEHDGPRGVAKKSNRLRVDMRW